MQLFRNLRKHNPTKAMRGADELLGFELSADRGVHPVYKQGSGMYGAGFGSNAFSETAFGTQIALSQSTFGWSAAYSVSTWVYRCIEVRKSAVHRMPWGVYSKRTQQHNPKHPLAVALRRNKQKIFKKIEQSQLLYGETFLEKAKNDYGYTSDLFWLNNNGMAVLQGAGYIMGYAYTAMQGGQPQTFDFPEVAFMKTDNPFNDLRGMSPTEVIMDDIAIDKDVARVVRAYYANDTRVGVIFIPKTNLLEGDQERFMEFFKKDNQGVNKAGKPIMMPQDMTVERIQEPATLDDVQLRESVRRSIAAGYGVPLSLAGGWDDAKYQSLPEQRKSFYEETIIPECDNIGDFINTDIMPAFDDSGNYYFAYDYTSILALTEDAQKKNDIYSNRLVSGLITRAEARQALGHPVRPQDDVYYIPVGATIVPADEEVLVTPQTNEVSDTSQEQQGESQQQTAPTPTKPVDNKPAQPTPPKPEQPKLPQPSAPKSINPPQDTAEDELTAWERKALNSNAVKAAGFVSYRIPKEVQTALRSELAIAGKSADKAAIKAIFAKARESLKWDETQHPRDDHGRFGEGGGGAVHGEDDKKKPNSENGAVVQNDNETHDWEGSTQKESDDYFNQHTVEPSLVGADTVHSYVNDYIGTGVWVNMKLRSPEGLSSLSSREKYFMGNLDEVLNENALPADTTLYRGVSGPFAETMTNLKPGETFTDKGFGSTSLQSHVPSEDLTPEDAVVKIKAPKGTKGAYVNSIFAKSETRQDSATGQYSNQQEFLLSRDVTYKVVSVEKTANHHLVNVEIVK